MRKGQTPTTPRVDVNGTGPPDRAQSLGLSTRQGRTRAQMPCPVFSCENPVERQLACGSSGDEAPSHASYLVRPRLAHARTRHEGTWEVTYAGAGPRARAQPLGFSNAAGTDLSTDVVPVLNHEAATVGFARAQDIRDEAPDRQKVIIRQLMQGDKLV